MRCTHVAGALLLSLGLLIGYGSQFAVQKIDARVRDAIDEKIIWGPDSPPSVQDRFRKPNATILVRYHFFNITNVDSVRAGAKPVLEEVGPFAYWKHAEKRGVRFGNGTVSFADYTYYTPAPEASGAALDAPITTLNLPLVAAVERIQGSHAPAIARSWLAWLARALDGFGSKAALRGVFSTRTAAELLWGYDDPLLARLHWLAPSLDPHFTLVHNTSSPEQAESRPATVMATDTNAVWATRSWRGLTQVGAWAAPHIEHVRGGDGLQFPPLLQPGSTHAVWVGEAFRALSLIARNQTLLHGVPLLRLEGDRQDVAINPTYFQFIRGLMNVTSPMAAGAAGPAGKAGPLLFLSMPHFCHADPELAAGVVGVACNPERHRVFLDVEPNTGITVRAARRIQLSSWFGPKYAAVDPDISPTFLPIFWGEETSQANPEQMQAFRPLLEARQMQAALRRWHWPLGAGLIGLGTLTLLIAVAGSDKPARKSSAQNVASAGVIADAGTDPEATPLMHANIGNSAGEEIEPLP